MFDVGAIQKYSSAVVLHPKPDTYFADLQHVCGFVKENVHVRVRVKLLNDGAFLLYFDQDYSFMSLYKMLSVSFEGWTTSGELELIQWTPEYGSVGCVVTQVVQLKITGLPCYLNSVPIIEYILAPFALVKTHNTAVNGSTSDLGNTITAYKCTAWCVTVEAIPSMLRVKVLPSYLADLAQIAPDSKCKCPVLDVFIYADAILDEPLHI